MIQSAPQGPGSGSAEWRGKVMVSGFPVGRDSLSDETLTDLCFSPVSILASDSPTPSAGSRPGLLHSEGSPVTNSTPSPSPVGCKVARNTHEHISLQP